MNPEFSKLVWGLTSVNLSQYVAPAGKVLGDATGDGKVDLADIRKVSSNWSPAGPAGKTWSQGDFTGDGAVNELDAAVLMRAMNYTGNSNAAKPRAGMESVRAAALKYFNSDVNSYYSYSARTNPDGDAVAWFESYSLVAYLNMYEATGDQKYLLRFMEDANQVLSERSDHTGVIDQVRNKVMPGWVTKLYGTPTAFFLHACMAEIPLARFAYLVKRDPTLRVLYNAKADEYIQAVAQTLQAYSSEWRMGPNPGEGYYVYHGVLDPVQPPMNFVSAAGSLLTEMYLATGSPAFKLRATQLATYVKNRLTVSNGAYVWKYSPANPYYTANEDISHGSITANFALRAFRAGIVFTSTDMQRFANTLRQCTIHDANGNAIAWYTSVTGTGSQADYSFHWGAYSFFGDDIARDFASYFPYQSTRRLFTAADVLLGTMTLTMEAPARP